MSISRSPDCTRLRSTTAEVSSVRVLHCCAGAVPEDFGRVSVLVRQPCLCRRAAMLRDHRFPCVVAY
ncbi:hypothetical protein ACLOJK_011548 [Asimina triloba]